MLDTLRRLPFVPRLLKRPVLSAIVALLVVGAALGGYVVTKGVGGLDVPEGPTTAEWLTVHYVAMDNNLDAYGEWDADLHSLEQVGSTPESHHVALYDGDEDGDTVIQYVVEGGVEERPTTDAYTEWPAELNLGDPATLAGFLIWAVEEYPAEKVCLVLNNHGGGWSGICWDDTDGDYLQPGEVAEALESFQLTHGRKVDVILAYACLMSCVEFLYEIAPFADYFVSSQTYSWGSEKHGEDDYLIGNYPHDLIFQRLKEEPELEPMEFAVHIVDAFQAYGPWNAQDMSVYRDYSSDTCSAIELAYVPELVLALDQMGKELQDSLTGLGKVVSQRQLITRVIGSPQEPAAYCTQSFSGQPDWIGQGTFTNYDILDLVEQLGKCDVKPLCTDATLERVRVAAEAAIFAERHGTDPAAGHHVDAHGMSIWLPYRYEEYRVTYETRAFAQDTSWDEFLRTITWL
jgi:hypothetical protein